MLTLATVTPGEPEIFASLQGEGASAGRPCTFVRLSRCNLACRWCDTAYTWRFTGDNRPHQDDETFDRSANQVTLDEAEVAARITALGQDRLVVTGGEPLLQGPALARMLQMLQGVRVEIETNGTVMPVPALEPLVAQYNVSPKLSHSGNPADLARIPAMLEHWTGEPKANFKFVISTPEDVEEVLAIADTYSIAPERIWLMPEGRDSQAIRARMVWLGNICAQQGFNLSDRLHIHLWGDTRGT